MNPIRRTLNAHVSKISSKLACAIGTFKRMKRFLPPYILKTLYNSLFLPYMNYGILLWGSNTKRIIRLQKFAVRAITNSKYNAHTDPIFRSHSLLKVTDIYKLNALKFYYKYKNGTLPVYLLNILEHTYSTHDHHTRQRNIPRPFHPNTASAKKAIRYAIPNILRHTPTSITDTVSTHSLQGYSTYIKKIMVSQYEETCTIVNCYVCNQT